MDLTPSGGGVGRDGKTWQPGDGSIGITIRASRQTLLRWGPNTVAAALVPVSTFTPPLNEPVDHNAKKELADKPMLGTKRATQTVPRHGPAARCAQQPEGWRFRG